MWKSQEGTRLNFEWIFWEDVVRKIQIGFFSTHSQIQFFNGFVILSSKINRLYHGLSTQSTFIIFI
jgi:hypothetical protein